MKKHKKNRNKVYKPRKQPTWPSLRLRSALWGLIAALIVIFISFYLFLTPINLRAGSFWVTLFIALSGFACVNFWMIALGIHGYEQDMATDRATWNEISDKQARFFLLPAVLLIAMLVIFISGLPIFHAHQYASILTVEDAVFMDDLAETLDTDSIALMDTASARILGDREIGSLSDVVSQYNVSDSYTQIDLNGSPMKVAALDYAGFFKWLGNRSEGVPGYVTVNPVSMSASYTECEEGMIYVPSAYFLEDAARYIRFHYPTLLLGNLHFEIDEDGSPYYVSSIYKKTISLFGGTVVDGAITLNPVTGELTRYALAEVPEWIDVVYDGDLICQHYNWYGTLQNGFINSIFGKKGCKQVTTYSSDDEESDDDVPVSDYGYVAKDGDIWIYTGVTSVNGDSSNIGFLLANERTGESHYYSIAGADEKSAMAAAEGEVQEKGYQASFPSLINVEGNPTYIMVLKDASGLVKLYAAVNVEQYNLVTTASTQSECIEKYKQLLGIESTGPEEDSENTNETGDENSNTDSTEDESEELTATADATITIQDIKYIDIDGNTYIYLISEDDQIYRAKASTHEEMLLLQAGDTVYITVAEKEIVTCEQQ